MSITPPVIARVLPEASKRGVAHRYRSDIDGLRAIAILSVVFFHAGLPFVHGGFIGVDIFFVISGLLIGAHVFADIREGRFSIADFYRKRAKRILPALLTLLVFCFVVGSLILSPKELKTFGGYTVATVLSSANILAWHKSDYFATDANQNPLLMAWSLGVEEQFYLIFPVLMLIFRKAQWRTLLIATLLVTLASLIAAIMSVENHQAATFYLLPTRAWELSVGILMAVYESGRDPRGLYFRQRAANFTSAFGLVLITFGTILYTDHTTFPGTSALLPVLGAALLLASPNSWFNRVVLSSRPMVFIGAISYSLYLWHWPLLSFADIISDRPLPLTLSVVIVAISFVLAWLSYKLIETPFRRSDAPNRLLLCRYGALCALALVPGVLFETTHGFPQRYPKLAPLEAFRSTQNSSCYGLGEPVMSSACVDVKDPRPAFALLGDSHAAAISPGVRKVAAAAGYKLYEMTKTSCHPLLDVTRVQTSTDERQCVAYNARVRERVVSDHSIRTVILTGYWAGPAIDSVEYVRAGRWHTDTEAESYDNLAYGLTGTVMALQAAGKRVILLEDVPVFRFDPYRRVMAYSMPPRNYLASLLQQSSAPRGAASVEWTYDRLDQEASDVLMRVGRERGVEVFDPKSNLCHDDTCAFYAAPYSLYFDKQHLSSVGAERALSGLHL